jgi:acyl-CoA thioesterase
MTQTPDAAQALAERACAAMFANDHASQGLGIAIAAIAPGRAAATMTVRQDMLNGFGLCHGGFITTLADTAFAFACNSYNEMTLASGIDAEFLKGAKLGDRLQADASEQSQAGRLGVYDIAVRNQHDELIALVRGRSYRLRGKPVVGA